MAALFKPRASNIELFNIAEGIARKDGQFKSSKMPSADRGGTNHFGENTQPPQRDESHSFNGEIRIKK